jgi:hypothetical protein
MRRSGELVLSHHQTNQKNKTTSMQRQLSLILLLLTIVAVLVTCAPPAPIWEKVWRASFTQTTPGLMKGGWYYDYNANRQRTDRINGKYDTQHCKGLDTYCVTLVDDKFTWVYWPRLQKCCTLCAQSDGCGIIKYDWLRNATFVAVETKNGVSAQKWFLQGGQKNYYWNTNDLKRAPVQMDAVEPGDFHMTFHPESFKTAPIDPHVFALPSYCSASTQC